ncbi:MAG: NAD(P)-dependent oxidoreductase [Hyphomicrobiales bacterium]
MKILVTGSSGLIGRAVCAKLEARGVSAVPFDMTMTDSDGERLDVRNERQVRMAIAQCQGVLHLAAVSRVIWGERDPALCEAVNVGGTEAVCRAARDAAHRPFVVYASSREVYGHPASVPVREDAPFAPCNVYGRTKVAGEDMMQRLARAGHPAAIIRFSNVYGAVDDHPDRVVPAFAQQAATGGVIRVDGASCVFDFTHVDDVSDGVVALLQKVQSGSFLPPVHFVSGRGSSLAELAEIARLESGGRLTIDEQAPRSFDVARFYGDPARARELLGWRGRTQLERGFAKLVDDFRAIHAEASGQRRGRATP